MSELRSRLALAHRRAVLTAGGSLAALASMTIVAGAASHQPAAAAAKAVAGSKRATASQTAAALRDVWVDHIFWVRNVCVAELDKNDAALKAAEAAAVANAQGLAGSIEPFYGAPAKDGFFKLLAGHYGAVKAYVVATVAGDAAGQTKATDDLSANADAIADFLSKANPNLPKDAVKGMLVAHGGHHIRQIQQLKARDYAGEAQTWQEMKAHVYQIADATANAVAKQFPDKFG